MHFISCINTTVMKQQQVEEYINCNNLHIIRVSPKTIGIGVEGNAPVLLKEGIHEIYSPQFEFKTVVDFSKRMHYQEGPLNLIFVPSGMVALCEVNKVGHFFKHKEHDEGDDSNEGQLGCHVINATQFQVKGIQPLTTEHLCVGRKHRVLVPSGKIGIYTVDGVPGVLNAGEPFYYEHDSFRYIQSYNLCDPVISHNSLKIITVKEGHAGIIYDEGVCVAYQKGRHVFTKPTQKFSGFLSLGTETFAIPSLTTVSADNVELTFNAAITIEMVDPAMACRTLMSSGSGLHGGGSRVAEQDSGQAFGQGLIHRTIADLARLHLASIVGHHKYNMAFKATQIISEEKAQRGGAIPSATNPEVAQTASPDQPIDFKGMLCSEFLQGAAAREAEAKAMGKASEIHQARLRLQSLGKDELDAALPQRIKELEVEYETLTEEAHRLAEPSGHKSFVAEMWEKGIKITKFSIEDIKINDTTLAKSMAQAALLDLEQAKANADAMASVARADGKAKVKKREAEGEAEARMILAEADYQAKVRLAEAEQEEIRIISEAMENAQEFGPMWSQWKLTRTAGEAIGQSPGTTLMLTPSHGDAAQLMAVKKASALI